MTIEAGSLLTLDVEKPAAGGRMLARHEGQVVLVWGAIPGERVRARVERAGKGVVYAESIDVLHASPDRVELGATDWRCGGSVFAHIAYGRQLPLKGEIVRDAMGRIGRVPLASPPDVVPSPPEGYRMRARLHARDGRLGFYREGTHDLCDARRTGQLLPATHDWISAAEQVLRRVGGDGVLGIEIAENIPASERATHLELREGVDPAPYAALVTARSAVSDVIHVREGDAASALRLRRDVRAFFQGNRFLLERLVRHVVSLVPQGPIVDLYAGVGLFGLSLAAAGAEDVTLVEGDYVSGRDLADNAEPLRERVRVEHSSVEWFLAGPLRMEPDARGTRPTYSAADPAATFIVDPPRTGMSRDAMRGIVRARPARLVYVSCDVATLARDARMLLDAGYTLAALTAFDLFPNTAHVESVALFATGSRP